MSTGPASARRDSGARLLDDGPEDIEYNVAPDEEFKAPGGGQFLAGDEDDGLVIKKKKKRRKPRAKAKKKVEVTLEHIERRLAKSFVVKTEKKSCKDVRISIDPRFGFMKRWDVVMIVCLVFTALVTPYEIAFLSEATESPDYDMVSDPLWWVNNVVSFLFFVDMIINFFLGFFDDEEGQWVFENKRIVLRYCKGWFSVDLISILPFELVGDAMQSDALSNLKILRIVRLLRLIKLVRVFRASRLFKRWEMSMDMSYSNLSLLKFLILVAVSVHWVRGCVFVLFLALSQPCFCLHQIACAWQLGPTMEDASHDWLDEFGLEGTPAVDRYVACVYVAIIALPMGVGDITPVTTTERVLCIWMMLIGGSIYAYVIGAICGVVSTRDPATTEFHQTMDHLNTFLAEINTPQGKRREIREYFHHCRQLFRAEYYNNLLLQMSPKLRGDVALHCHRLWVEQISFFRAESDEERQMFITAIALNLNLEAYAPKELIIKTGEFTEKMYIIQRGLVARLGRVLGAGRFFGEDVILHNSRRNYFVRVLTYLDVYSLSKEDLDDILTVRVCVCGGGGGGGGGGLGRKGTQRNNTGFAVPRWFERPDTRRQTQTQGAKREASEEAPWGRWPRPCGPPRLGRGRDQKRNCRCAGLPGHRHSAAACRQAQARPR